MNTAPQTAIEIDDDIRQELRRRFENRNAPGYFGLNNRVWLRFHIQAIRSGKPYGHRSY